MNKFHKMQVVNPFAAGIDVGSRSHFVAVGEGENEIKEFNVYQSGIEAIISFLKQFYITTVAMEATGTYWQNLFMSLQDAGFEVLLVQGTQTKNVRGKTDVKDAQWIQKLHKLGLLRGSFLPTQSVLDLRTLVRHRSSLIDESSKFSNKMQKALRLMNFRLDVAISDITGKSGMAIIKAILDGELRGEVLAKLCDKRVKKSEEEIADALQGHYNSSLMYELRDCYEMYQFLRQKIQKLDIEIDLVLKEQTNDIYIDEEEEKKLVKKQTKGKNQPKIGVQKYFYKLFGTDIMAIESVNTSTVLSFLSEVGTDIYKFKTAKQFVNWLRLAPNNKVSGGKTISSKTPKGKNKFALALRNAANTIEKSKEGFLVMFFRRIAYRKGRAAAITATARKMATIIWNMIMTKQKYTPIKTESYLEKMKLVKTKQIKKMIAKYQIDIASLSAT